MSYEEEDTCMSYEEEDTCMSYEEEDTCMSYEEEDTYLDNTELAVSLISKGPNTASGSYIVDRCLRDQHRVLKAFGVGFSV